MIENLRKQFVFRMEKRANVSRMDLALATAIAILGAFLVCAILMKLAGASIIETFMALFGGAFGGQRSILETLVKTTPLLLTAEAVTLAFRGKIWNIGAEGQLFTGAILAYWAYLIFQGLPPLLMFVVIVLAGFVGGAICGGIAGVLKARFNVDVIISTVMLNYIVEYLLSFLLSGNGPWRAPDSFYPHTPEIAVQARWLLMLPPSRLHIGFIIALGMAVFTYYLLEKTVFGLKIRSLGLIRLPANSVEFILLGCYFMSC